MLYSIKLYNARIIFIPIAKARGLKDIGHEEVEKMGRTIAQSLIEEGIVEGKKEGLSQGMQQMIIETLELRFEIVPVDIIEAINYVMNVNTLRMIQRYAIQSGSIKDFDEKMKESII
jgi:hypothetical protein